MQTIAATIKNIGKNLLLWWVASGYPFMREHPKATFGLLGAGFLGGLIFELWLRS